MLDGHGGDDFILGYDGHDVLIGADGDDYVRGYGGDDELSSGPGQDVLLGGSGNDTYVISGGGYDYIDAHGGTWSDYNVIELRDVLPEQVVVQHGVNGLHPGSSFGDLVISYESSWIEVLGWFWAANSGNFPIDEIHFDDGTVWDSDVIISRLGQPTDYADHLFGSSSADVLAGQAGNDWLEALGGDDTLIGGPGDDRLDGGAGSDTYEYRPGDGSDHLSDSGPDAEALDVLQLLGGIRPADVTVLPSIASDLRIALSDGATMTLSGFFDGEGIDEVHFDDGTVWTPNYVEVPENAPPVAVADSLQTTESQVLVIDVDSLLANDGDPDADPISLVSVQDATRGAVELRPNGRSIEFIPEDWFVGEAGFSYTISDGNAETSGIVTVVVQPPANAMLGSDSAEAIAGSRKNDVIYGLGGDDFLDGDRGNDRLYGGTGNDLLIGGKGNDIFVFNIGDQHDLIDNGGGGKRDFDVLQFGVNIHSSDLSWQRSGDNLLITLAAGEGSVTINDWYANSNNQLDEIRTADATLTPNDVEQLVDSVIMQSVSGGLAEGWIELLGLPGLAQQQEASELI